MRRGDFLPGFPVVSLKSCAPPFFQDLFDAEEESSRLDACIRRCAVMYVDGFVHEPECASAPKSVLNFYIAAG